MARSTQQILRELDTFFEPSRKVIRQQKDQIQPFVQAQLQGLDTQKENAFRGITAEAQRRGISYSGMPIAEQARYVGDKFLPARANVEQAGVEAQNSLASALANLEKERGLLAQSIYQQELDRDEARRAAQAAAASNSAVAEAMRALMQGEQAQAQEVANLSAQELAEAAKKAGRDYADAVASLDRASRFKIFNALVNRYDQVDGDDRMLVRERVGALAKKFGYRDPFSQQVATSSWNKAASTPPPPANQFRNPLQHGQFSR